MSPKHLDISGEQFGRLTAIRISSVEKYRPTKWLCKCNCGGEIVATINHLRVGATKSCGCLKTEAARSMNFRHGMTNTRAYRIWKGMVSRVTNSNNHSFPDYGGRGIKMCQEWQDDFGAFWLWAVSSGYSDNLSIDRIDNELGYYPSNCRGATKAEQARNRRPRSCRRKGNANIAAERSTK